MPTACILSTVDMSRMTMVSVYIEYFEKNNIPYDIIYVDRYKDKPAFRARKLYAYNVERFVNAAFPIKLAHYWRMRPFARKILKENEYDFVVVWGELAAFIFADVLKDVVPGRYCLNIRDYFYNKIAPVQWRLKTAVRAASFCTVSSEAYLEYLPTGNFMMLHSLNPRMLSGLEAKKTLRERGKPIRILYLGLIARLEYVHKLIDELGNDDRYELVFAGIGAEHVDEYIAGKDIRNVVTYGRFPQSETAKYLEQADVLYNLYGHGNRHFDLALSIKLYYALFLNIPIMAFDHTHTHSVAAQCELAFSVDCDDFSGMGDRLYDWYYSVDVQKTGEKSRRYMQKALESHEELYRRITAVITKSESKG